MELDCAALVGMISNAAMFASTFPVFEFARDAALMDLDSQKFADKSHAAAHIDMAESIARYALERAPGLGYALVTESEAACERSPRDFVSMLEAY